MSPLRPPVCLQQELAVVVRVANLKGNWIDHDVGPSLRTPDAERRRRSGAPHCHLLVAAINLKTLERCQDDVLPPLQTPGVECDLLGGLLLLRQGLP